MSMRWPNRALMALFVVGGACLLSTPVESVPPPFEPHCGSGILSRAADIAYDTTDDTVWMLDRADGTVCHYQINAIGDPITPLGSIPHPFGPSSPIPPFTPVMEGLTYNPVSDTLIVLNASTQEIQEFDKLGTAVGGPIPLAPPVGAAVSGLAYDTLTDTLWYRDINNDLLVNAALLTGATLGTIPIPGNVPPETTLFGQGLAFVDSGGQGFLEITYGTVLEFAADRVIRVDMTGAPTGLELDLTVLDDGDLVDDDTVRGVVRPPAGTAVYVCTDGDLYQLIDNSGTVLPPSQLTCLSGVEGNYTLTWNNNGAQPGGAYDEIRIMRSTTGAPCDAGIPDPNEQLIGLLGGSAVTFTDLSTPLDQTVTYKVRAISGASAFTSCCEVKAGSGALIGYTPFSGGRVKDLALDPVSGLLYASDAFGDSIHVFDAMTMQEQAVLSNPSIQNPSGIAFRPSSGLPGDFDRLVVARTVTPGNNLLRALDPVTGAELEAFPVAIPDIDITAMSYDPVADDYLLMDATSTQLVRVEANPNNQGQLISTCAPPVPSGLVFSNGVSFLEIQEDFLATIDGGGIRRFDVGTCFETVPSTIIPLDGIGGSFGQLNAVNGIEDLENTVFVAGGLANAIFQLLIFPSGSLFIRGDANNDAVVDLADALFIADYLFQGGPQPGCLDAADANDDGQIDISDSLYEIIFLFLMGSPPPAPYPAPGSDPTFLDGIPCAN